MVGTKASDEDDTVTEGPEFALKECPAYMPVTAPEGPEYVVVNGRGRDEFALKECPAYMPVTAPKDPEYMVVHGRGRDEFALRECPAYVPVTASGGGAGESVATGDDELYETLYI